MKAVQDRRPRLMAWLLAVCVVIGFCPGVLAQFSFGGSDMSGFATSISRRSLADYGRILELDAGQKEALKTLHEGYVEAHQAIMAEMSRVMESIQEQVEETRDFKLYQKELPKHLRDIGGRMERLEAGFYDDLKALLSGRQSEQWPRIERHRKRENGLRFGFISGQAVDLVKVVEAIKADPAATPGLADQLERYELDMDRALEAFTRLSKEQQEKALEWDFDFSKMQEMMQKAREMMKKSVELAKGIRDVNRQYARTIGPVLPEALRPKFEAEFNRRAHPRIYQRSYPDKALDAAAGFADLSADQQGGIAELRAAYQRELESANRKWASATEDREEKTGGQMVEMMSMFGGEQADEGEDASARARAERRDLDKRTKEKLLALLNEEQRGRLPEEKRERRGWGGDGYLVQPDDEPDDE